MIKVIAKLSDEHDYDEMEELLSNTMYLGYQESGKLFASVEIDEWHMKKDLLEVIREDLFNLGLLVDVIAKKVINNGH